MSKLNLRKRFYAFTFVALILGRHLLHNATNQLFLQVKNSIWWLFVV